MVSKLSWVLFIPLTLAAAFLKLAQTILPDNSIFGMSDMMLDYAVIGCVALIFLFALIMCLCDRRISKYYLPHRNIPAGIIGLLLALLLAADGAYAVNDMFVTGKVEVLPVIEAVMLLFAAIVFVVMGLAHSFSGKGKKTFGLLYAAPALLCAIRLIRCFVEFTTISITLADITRLFCYIFATMFFFNYAVALSMTEAKNAVKSCFIYGFPASAAMISYAAGNLYANLDTDNIMNNAHNVEIALMGLYILAFLIELTIFVKDRDHVVIADQEDEEYKDIHDGEISDSDDFVVTGLDDDERSDVPASNYVTTADTSDFLYQEVRQDEKRQATYYGPTTRDVDDYITQEVKSDFDEPGNEKSYADQLDEIDKLILEISGDK